MSTNLLNLEANYAWSEGRYSSAPTAEKGKELAKKQILIDQLRLEKKWPTRWFTEAELDQLSGDADCWPTEPRKSLAQVAAEEPSRVEEEKAIEKLVETVEWDGYTTLTLDSVIAMLEKMREKYGGKTPVMGVEFGGFSSLSGVQEDDGCIVIE
jgi:hypothetical protein